LRAFSTPLVAKPALNQPSPAIIAQSAVRRLPRLALLLFCVAYVLPGFVGREPWKNVDITTFGVMQQLAATGTDWLHPNLMGQSAGFDSLLPYWLGAVAIKFLPFLDPALAARLPYIALLALTLIGTWYTVYYLARSPQAQPVAFAFGGEASPVDYARAIADAGLLALLACLGLAQLSHETTPAMAQLGFMTLMFFSVAASPYQNPRQSLSAGLAFVLGMTGLALSGAPAVAALLGLGSILVEWAHGRWGGNKVREPLYAAAPPASPDTRGWMLLMVSTTLTVAALAYVLGQWAWRLDVAALSNAQPKKEWGAIVRLLLWFPWPAWPLALWTLFRWRRQLASRHVALPLWFASVTIGTTLLTTASDRSLLLSLPPLATLAAFALPTLRRSVASLIDWFTLLFFTSCVIAIWVVWVAMQTGVPRQPAANVAKLAPGFEPSFSMLTFVLALLATLGWAWLVRWRTGRQQAPIWKSLILPAAGTTLCWLLLMTLWLPLLDYARSYAATAQQVARQVNRQACVEVLGLNTAQTAALRYHSQLDLRHAGPANNCPYLVVNANDLSGMDRVLDRAEWQRLIMVRRPLDRNENVLVFRRLTPTAESAGQ
jgi:4-amino-4-deoxy-L-arabinose transferase-like glycosyltransferase